MAEHFVHFFAASPRYSQLIYARVDDNMQFDCGHLIFNVAVDIY